MAPRHVRDWTPAPMVPLLLITLAMAFCIVATTSKEWAHRARQTGDTPSFSYTEHRSPVYNCVWEVNTNITSPADPPRIEDCTNWERCSQRENYENEGDTDLLCAWLDNSFNLLMSANGFWGVAFLLSLISFTVSAPVLELIPGRRGRYRRERLRRSGQKIVRALSIPTFVASLCGIVMLILSQTLGTVGLLLVQPTQGDFTLSNLTVVQDGTTPWLPGIAQVYLFVSWMIGILSLVAISSTLSMPHASGYWRQVPEEHNQHDHIGVITEAADAGGGHHSGEREEEK